MPGRPLGATLHVQVRHRFPVGLGVPLEDARRHLHGVHRPLRRP